VDPAPGRCRAIRSPNSFPPFFNGVALRQVIADARFLGGHVGQGLVAGQNFGDIRRGRVVRPQQVQRPAQAGGHGGARRTPLDADDAADQQDGIMIEAGTRGGHHRALVGEILFQFRQVVLAQADFQIAPALGGGGVVRQFPSFGPPAGAHPGDLAMRQEQYGRAVGGQMAVQIGPVMDEQALGRHPQQPVGGPPRGLEAGKGDHEHDDQGNHHQRQKGGQRGAGPALLRRLPGAHGKADDQRQKKHRYEEFSQAPLAIGQIVGPGARLGLGHEGQPGFAAHGLVLQLPGRREPLGALRPAPGDTISMRDARGQSRGRQPPA
jgi:hypothetical protein